MKVTFIDGGRYPKCPPDPKYPNGVNVDRTDGAKTTCIVNIPYPAPRCGLMVVECSKCGLITAVTVAGRVDDPRTLRLACKLIFNKSVDAGGK